ncbi:MAG: hypothetical protein HUU50_16695 [Candidatus Brocadiae bacterium]|nr:hypothetical protein [Candidatus Brocadiia bacterium]
MEEFINILEIERYAHCLIGRLALDYGFVIAKDLISAIKVQHENPKKKMGELLIEMGFATKNQIAELLAFQKGMFKKVHQWNCLPDTLIKGFVYFENTAFSFLTLEDIKEAEIIREEKIIQENQHLLLHNILEETKGKELISQLKKRQGKVRLFYYECKQCNRLYRLFDIEKVEDSVYCPVCWDVPLMVFHLKDNTIPAPKTQEKITKIPINLESIQISQYYEILKKMEPLRRNEIVNHWKQEQESMTIKQVLGSLTRRVGEEEEVKLAESPETEGSQDHPTNAEVYVTRRIDSDSHIMQESLEEKNISSSAKEETLSDVLSEEDTKPISPTDSTPAPIETKTLVEKSSALQTLARKTRRFLKGESLQSLIHRDMSQIWLALQKKIVSEDDVVYAFFIQNSTRPGEPKNSLVEILKERGIIQPKQYQTLVKIENLEIPVQKLWDNKKDIDFCHYLFEREILPKDDLQKIMLVQNSLYKLGIRRTYKDLLILSKWLSQDTVQFLYSQFEKQSQGKKIVTSIVTQSDEGLTKTKTKAVFKMDAMKGKTTKKSYRLVYAIGLVLVALMLYSLLKTAPKKSPVISENKVLPSEKTETPLQNSKTEPEKTVSLPQNTSVSLEKKEPAPTTETPKETVQKQTLVPVTVDGMAMIALHQILPKVPHLAETLQKNFEYFLQKPSLATYKNNQEKWEGMMRYHFKDKLISLDATYQSKEIKEKMQKLHLLYENLENLGKGLLKYLQEQKENAIPKNFLELLQASKTTLYASESKNLLLEISGQKYTIFEIK